MQVFSEIPQNTQFILYNAFVDRVCLGFPKQCIVGYPLTTWLIGNVAVHYIRHGNLVDIIQKVHSLWLEWCSFCCLKEQSTALLLDFRSDETSICMYEAFHNKGYGQTVITPPKLTILVQTLHHSSFVYLCPNCLQA